MLRDVPGLTCARCLAPLYPRPATPTQEGYVHATKCPRVCSLPDCTRPHVANGYCGPCNRRGGQPSKKASTDHLHVEDLAWMAETGECWDGAVRRSGVKAKTLEKWLTERGRYDLVSRMRSRETPLTSGSRKAAA